MTDYITYIKHDLLAAAVAALMLTATVHDAAAQSRSVSRADVAAVTRRADAGDPDALNQLGVWHYSGQHVAKDVDKAVGLWRQAAAQGNPKAIANLGICYQYGTGVLRDSITAMHLYVAAIDNGQETLLEQRKANVGKVTFDGILTGLCYEKGIGVDADAAEAARAYSASADLGSADAAAAAARCLLASGNATAAYRYAAKAADAGNHDAEAMAGIMLVDGKGVTPSTEKGVRYLLKAAPYNADAANRLATLMFAGAPEVNQHSRRITTMLTDAARQGNRQAMLNYARALRDGIGVNRDYDRAIHWLSLAGQTDDEAVNRFITMSPEDFRNYSRGRRLVTEGKFDEADRIFKNLERKKITEATIMRGYILAHPDNPDANTDDAIKQLRKYSGKNNQATTTLALVYLMNKQDIKAMLPQLERAAEQGYGPAAAILARIYRDGDGVTPDSWRAASFARQAYTDHDIPASEMSLYRQ